MLCELPSDTVQNTSVVENDDISFLPSVGEDVFWSVHLAL